MAPACLYVGEKQQQRWKVVALGKALAIHQAFALEDLVSQQEAVGRDEIDLGVVRPARKQALRAKTVAADVGASSRWPRDAWVGGSANAQATH